MSVVYLILASSLCEMKRKRGTSWSNDVCKFQSVAILNLADELKFLPRNINNKMAQMAIQVENLRACRYPTSQPTNQPADQRSISNNYFLHCKMLMCVI